MAVEPYVLGALRSAFVSNVRRHRRRLGWSQERLALEAGFNRVYLNGIEAGRRNVSLDNVEKLAVALGVDPIELLLSPRAPLTLATGESSAEQS